ncbi:MAG: DUF881 domain-containing protein [Coriobacteriia bacterium]|nr:DUF881 domain-containing protein [Coriobacteriia bacterium]
MAVVFCVLGFMLAVAFNTKARSASVRPERAADLPAVVRDMERQRHALQDRLEDLRDSMAEADRLAAADAGVRESFSAELEAARAAAGLTAVQGPGVEILLGDGKDVPPGADPNDYLIHDYDLSGVVNALLAGGAEAVSVNGERIVATTPIRCAGTTILVNSTRLGNPYVVLAVGDPDALARSVLDDPMTGPVFGAYKTRYGLEARLVTRAEITVPSYRGSTQPAYARPGGGAS